MCCNAATVERQKEQAFAFVKTQLQASAKQRRRFALSLFALLLHAYMRLCGSEGGMRRLTEFTDPVAEEAFSAMSGFVLAFDGVYADSASTQVCKKLSTANVVTSGSSVFRVIATSADMEEHEELRLFRELL